MSSTLHTSVAVVAPDGSLRLDHLPFPSGQQLVVEYRPSHIEIRPATAAREPSYPLRGTPVRYERPMDPVAESDWDVLQ